MDFFAFPLNGFSTLEFAKEGTVRYAEFFHGFNVDSSSVFLNKAVPDARDGVFHRHRFQEIVFVFVEFSFVNFGDGDVELVLEFYSAKELLECFFAAAWPENFDFSVQFK